MAAASCGMGMLYAWVEIREGIEYYCKIKARAELISLKENLSPFSSYLVFFLPIPLPPLFQSLR